MNSDRKAAIAAGVMFIIADITGVLSAVLGNPVLHGPNYLVQVAAHANQATLAGLLEFMMGAACAGIAISLYPVLKRHHEGLSIGAVAFGVIEGILFMVASIGCHLMVRLGQKFAEAGTGDGVGLLALGTLLRGGHDSAYELAGIAFVFGAIMYYYIMYRAKLIPRWLSTWGLIATMLCLAESFTGMFHLLGETIQSAFIVPLGIEEIVLALWLILKGFSSSAVDSGIVRT